MNSKRSNVQGLRGTRRRGRRRGLGGGRNSVHPPQFVPTMALSHKFRYINGANSGVFTITRANLLNQILVATSAVTTVRLFEGIRLQSVEVWANPTALGSAPTEVQVEWLGENSPSTLNSDMTMGVRPSHVATTPPPSSSNRWWSMSGSQETDQLFLMRLPADCVIDVVCELRFVEAETPTAGDIPAGAVLGTLYGDYLDGIASGKLVPVGYNAIP